jgi:phosphate transport system substrate-binding protein
MLDRLVPALVESHRQTVGDIAFEVADGDLGEGFKQLLSGEADIAAASRLHTPAEEEQAKANGYTLDDGARHLVAVNVVAVAVHPSNPVDALTYDQVIGVFCTGSVDNWGFLGQDEMPIRPITRDPSSGTRAVFEDFFCGPKGMHPRVEVLSIDEIHDALASDPAAISFVSLAEQSGKVLGLRPDVAGHPVLPSQQNVIRGAYPLYHDMYMYTPGPTTGVAQQFLAWISSPAGQEVVDEVRFVPLFLRPERMNEPRPLRETIQFEPESREPNQRSMARLNLLVDELRDRAGEYRHVVLEGYTDRKEPDPQGLAQARAEGVRALLDKELPGTFFEIIPRGAVNPIAPNATPYGRQQNRRVQIYLADEERTEDAPVVHNEDG